MPPKRSEEPDNQSEAGSEGTPPPAVPGEPAPPPEKKLDPIPDAVDYFLAKLMDAIGARNVPDLNKLYEVEYNKITEDHYKSRRWPSVESVAEKVSSEPLFLILYKELYYRHVYCTLNPQYEDRRGSWENYCKLLDLITLDLQEGCELSVALPIVWIWDILDEFVYHFQTYCTMRNKVVKSGAENLIQPYREHPDVFVTAKVLTYLHQLVKLSKVEAYLANKEGGTGFAFTCETTRYIGYFSLIQLLRMHTLLADYHLAMKTIHCIDIHEEVPLFFKIPACHVTLYYYMGWCYLMMRRYVDATRMLSDVLVFLSKISGVNEKSYQFDAIKRKQDQMYYLLLVLLVLCPRPIDESLEKKIRQDSALLEKQTRLQRGEELAFEDAFSWAAPKFVSAAPPNYDKLEDFHAQEVKDRQWALFQTEMRQQKFLPKIDSYMKLYTAIKMDKLAQLCDMDPVALRDQLMCVMHKTSQKVWTKGNPLDGEPQHCSEVEFYLDGDMVHINAHRSEREHSEVFMEQILKFQEMIKKLGNKAEPAAKGKDAPAAATK